MKTQKTVIEKTWIGDGRIEEKGTTITKDDSGNEQTSSWTHLRSSDWLSHEEIRLSIIGSLPYYEAEDKDDAIYVARLKDVDLAVEAIIAAARSKEDLIR